MSKPAVGFNGLGLMGRPMAANLLKAGFPLTVWNRTASRIELLVNQGAKAAATPREAAAAADVLIAIVSDPPALEQILWGEQGAVGGLRRGSVLVDSSTVSPVLGAMGKRWFHLGPHGAGQTVKLAMNMLFALEVDALAEALALATAGGVPGEKLVEVMQSSMGRAPVLDVKAPLLLKHEYPPSFPLRLMHKDLTLALELAKQLGVPLPAGAAARETYDAVLRAAREDLDYAAIGRFWEKKS